MTKFVFVLVILQIVSYIAAEECPQCSKHEVLVRCITPCPPTCQTPNPPVCNDLRCQKGCACKPGLIRDETTNECIPPNLCPKDCGENQEYTRCGATCIQTCQNLNNPPFCPSNQSCTPGCICRKGFIFDEASKECIPRRRCLEGANYVASDS